MHPADRFITKGYLSIDEYQKWLYGKGIMTESVKEKINVFWFLPTHGGRWIYPTCNQWRWPPTIWGITVC